MPRSFLIFTCCVVDSSNEDLLKRALEEVARKYPGAIVEEPDVRVDEVAGMTTVGLLVEMDVIEMFHFRDACSAALGRSGLLLLETLPTPAPDG